MADPLKRFPILILKEENNTKSNRNNIVVTRFIKICAHGFRKILLKIEIRKVINDFRFFNFKTLLLSKF